ncbi:MAG TPA: protealysin inhibitor emfourin [Gemmataceae bacterium]|nr:protealysin inhibitor emfourin [Gemmataceae bacterium]
MKKILFLAANLVGAMALAVAGRAGCLPEQDAGYVKVHFHRTPGVPDFNSHPAVDLDGKNMTADEAKALRKRIEDAGFFDLQSSPTPPPNIPDPPAGYDLTVDMDGRTHTIWVVDHDVSKTLKPLIDWLNDRATLIELHDKLVVPAKAREEEQPAIRVEFAKSGGIAGLSFPPTVIDGATLSAADAHKLAKLIADARFFEQPERFPATEIPDGFSYTITVEMNGKRHTIHVAEDVVPMELAPLIDWISTMPISEAVVGCMTTL